MSNLSFSIQHQSPLNENVTSGVEEVVQQLRVLTTLQEYPSSINSINASSQLSVTLVPGYLTSSFPQIPGVDVVQTYMKAKLLYRINK